ncbi:sensor histidine kinase [Shinella kummerowiae]|jgi:signal transduction histidine kinase|uniref:histidine kinase n=1 Tax=Shinella kummerowiae TaxID=417745 RepID=A0A6N8S7R8_9HYPH|nr:HAMP domain-containing sensor histidine kinase [Shinella kummerowiae]MXN44753.1 sensor histidine kinase [Shinella kummerowiae]
MVDRDGTPSLTEKPVPAVSFLSGLSGRLLLLTAVFVLIAEVLIFVPSVANMRLQWLRDRLNTAAAASVVIEGLPDQELPRAVQAETLMATGAKAIVLKKQDASRIVAAADMPPSVDAQYDLSDVSTLTSIYDAFDTLVFGGDRIIRVFGPVGESSTRIELLLDEYKLRRAMLGYARNVFILSMIISLVTASPIFFALNRLLIRPIRRMTANIQEFTADPSNPSRVLEPSGGRDEIAVAGVHLAAMQQTLQRTLKEQKNLADLGLAVSKINHDMRNILSSAQLMSDRLSDVDDPVVKRVAPKLLRSIDRAVGYTNEVLSYGRMREPEPRRRFVALRPLVQEVSEVLALDSRGDIEFTLQVEPGLQVDADSEQLFRVIHNLCRNAVEALSQGNGVERRTVLVTGLRTGSVVSIAIDDNGPGMPAKARENLFAAFRGSARSGGTGLGLAIARELVLAHGGTIALVEKVTPGTLFRIELPDRPVPLDAFRHRA